MRCYDGSYKKDRYFGDRGHTIFDVTCFCGKFCLTWTAYTNHMRAKHLKMVRKLKKSGQWQQDKIEWRRIS